MDYALAPSVDHLPGLVWCARADGRVEYVNRRWREYTGLSLEPRNAGASADWEVAIHAADRPHWRERWQFAAASHDPWELELRLRRSDGAYRWFLCRACPETSSRSRIVRWCGINIDIDDRRQIDIEGRKGTQDALGKARSQLARVARLTTASALTASIAHEVSQPLSGIVTNASVCLRMLNAEPPNIDNVRAAVRRTIRDANRASDVITRLRALFSKKAFAMESFDLAEATREVIALMAGDLRNNRVVLHLNFAEDLPAVVGDRVQLQQVLLNLVRNASDAMAEVYDRARRLSVSVEREDGDRVRLTVRDAGVGLSGQNIDTLFDPFYTTKSGGMGIGLSVSRSIVEHHHGRIWAAPNAGPGATFAFSIPIEWRLQNEIANGNGAILASPDGAREMRV